MGKKLARVKWDTPLKHAFMFGYFKNTGTFMGAVFELTVSHYGSYAGTSIHFEVLSGPREGYKHSCDGCGSTRDATARYVGEHVKAVIYEAVTGQHPMRDGYTE